MFENVLGHEPQIEILSKTAKEGAVAHAYIFSGPDGTGKKLVATGFAKLLDCKAADRRAADTYSPCSCVSCSKIDRGIHPDVVFIEFEGVKNIKVEQVREGIEDRLYLKPYEGKYKVVIVDDAERMSNSAQNAFLKTLEEPPPDSVIILITSDPNSLLPTIRSRCRLLRFGPLPERLIHNYLLDNSVMSPEDAAIAARICDGSLGQAIRLNGESLELRKEFILSLSGLRRNSASAIIGLAEALPQGSSQEDADNLRLAFKFMTLWLRDLVMLKIGYDDNAISHRDILDISEQIAAGLAVNDILERQKLVEDTWRDISRANANKQLALENLFMKLADN